MKWAGNVAHMAEVKYAYKIWDARPEGRKTLGTNKRNCEDNTKYILEK
jgi:hypothetical protein